MPPRSEVFLLVKRDLDGVAIFEPTTANPSKQRPVIARTVTEVYMGIEYVCRADSGIADLLSPKVQKSETS